MGVVALPVGYPLADLFMAVKAFVVVDPASYIVAADTVAKSVPFGVGAGEIAGRDKAPETEAYILGASDGREKYDDQRRKTWCSTAHYEPLIFPPTPPLPSYPRSTSEGSHAMCRLLIIRLSGFRFQKTRLLCISICKISAFSRWVAIPRSGRPANSSFSGSMGPGTSGATGAFLKKPYLAGLFSFPGISKTLNKRKNLSLTSPHWEKTPLACPSS